MMQSRMNAERGQVSILIAIIFQVVFIFFAMVVNVGLVVNDKINLQNSVDIAAYYGAMKQAEVLNAMAHVNYQIRQINKLLNWRLWALADAGRNTSISDFLTSGTLPPDAQASWKYSTGAHDFPVICIDNPFWYEQHKPPRKGDQNLCQNADLFVPSLPPIKLGALQSTLIGAILKPLEAQSRINANKYAIDFKESGSANYRMALKMLVSYKYALKDRKLAMHRLQDLLVNPNRALGAKIGAGDFKDLTGNSVKDTVILTFRKNLTAANKDGFANDLEFGSSFIGHPFVVPIEIRVFLNYLDFKVGPKTQALVKNFPDIPEKPVPGLELLYGNGEALAAPDMWKFPPATAESFSKMSEEGLSYDFKSIAGYEKNPWVLGYVYVKAVAHPKMLFSPRGIGEKARVELTAESFAMPFGGRIGPWYSSSWKPGQAQSGGGGGGSGSSAGAGSGKIDALLPPRIGSPGEGDTVANVSPNYSRFPGDTLGMNSEAARTLGLGAAVNVGPRNLLPHFQDDDYANLIADAKDVGQDPVVYRSSGGGVSQVRSAEIAAVAPDLFDAVYFSVNPNFKDFLLNHVGDGGRFFFSSICPTCHDLGSLKIGSGNYTDVSVAQQIEGAAAISKGQAYWLLPKVDYLFTSWAQESTDNYDVESPTMIGAPEVSGGRIGYSVKIVSKKYLSSPIPLSGGPTPTAGSILNPPSGN